MALKWKVFLLVLISVVLAILIYLGVEYYRQYTRAPLQPVHAISQKALFFAEFPDASLSHKRLLQTSLWQSLMDIHAFERFSMQVSFIDSLMLASDPLIAGAAQPLIVSFYQDKTGSLIPVYILGLPPGDHEKMVSGFIKKVNGMQSIVMQLTYRNTVISMVNIPGIEQFFHYLVYRGLFIGSFDSAFLETTVDHLAGGKAIVKDADFQKISQTSGKNVDANLYILYENIGGLSEAFGKPQSAGSLKGPGRLGKYGETDLVINDSSWLFNGYSISGDTDNHLLNCFRQEPQSINIPSVLPDNTAYMSHFGVQKFERYFADFLKFRSDSTECLASLALLKKNFDISPYDDLISWVGNEFAIAGVKSGVNDMSELVVAIHTQDALKARLSLGVVAEKFNKKQNLKSFSLRHDDFLVGKINYPTLAKVLFGPLFSGLEENYYVLVKDYILLANHPDVLTNLIDRFYVSKTLNEDINYRVFSNNIADKSNIYLYGNIPSAISEAGKIFSGGLYDWIASNEGTLVGLEGIAIQFSFVNQMFYTNGYIKYNPGNQAPKLYGWSLDFESNVAGIPTLVRNPQTGKRNVLVFNEQNQLVLVNHSGQLLWSIQVSEPPVGPVHLIDYFKNGETQVLFNSAGYIHLIGLNGYYIDGFPVKLIRNATNGLSVFDYNSDKDYRLVVALDDNRIYSFDRSVKEVEGFTKIQSRTKITKPVQHLVAGDKDYFFVTDVNGEVIITNRRGDDRVSLKKSLEKAPNSLFYINKTNQMGLFLTTDIRGNLVYIDASGKITQSVFGEFGSGHYFIYEDMDGDGNHEFIFIDGKKLTVFDRFKKIIFAYDLPGEVIVDPSVFSHGKNKKYICIALPDTQQIMLFDGKGRAFEHLELAGDRPPAAGSLDNDGRINLITGRGKTIVNYQLD